MAVRTPTVFSTIKTISLLWLAALLVSCGSNDDNKEEVPIAMHQEVEQMLNNIEVTDITCITAKLTCTLMSPEYYSRYYPDRFIDMWIGLSSEENYHPEVDGEVLKGTHFFDSRNEKNFTANLLNLKPCTTYYFNVVFKVDSVTFYGDVHSFTTESVDKYLSMNVTQRDFTSVMIEGESQIEDVVEGNNLSLKYKKVNLDYNPKDYVQPTRTGNKLSATISNLQPAVEYEYWLSAVGKKGNVETSKQTFRTPSPAEYIYVTNVSNTSDTSVDIFVTLDDEIFQSSSQSTIKIRYGTDKDNLSSINASVKQKSPCVFTATLNRLEPNTTYYYRVGVLWFFGDAQADWFYSEPLSFVSTNNSGG